MTYLTISLHLFFLSFDLYGTQEELGKLKTFLKISMGLRIACGCQARVGKDTSVDYLIKKYGGKKLSFAGPLYEILWYAQDKCGFPRSKDRKFLQWVGTEWARAQEQNVWVRLFEESLQELPETTNIYVSDVRFPNELQTLKKHGFICIRLVRTSEGLDSQEKNHSSENSLLNKDWDYVLENQGSLESLHRKLDVIVKEA